MEKYVLHPRMAHRIEKLERPKRIKPVEEHVYEPKESTDRLKGTQSRDRTSTRRV